MDQYFWKFIKRGIISSLFVLLKQILLRYLFMAYTTGSKVEVIMNIFSLLAMCLLTFIVCDLLWKKFIKRLWYPDKKPVRKSEVIDILSEPTERDQDNKSINFKNTKQIPTPSDAYLYKFFIKHKRRGLRVNKHFLQTPICRMENLFARTYPNEYGHLPPLKIVSHLPNKLLK